MNTFVCVTLLFVIAVAATASPAGSLTNSLNSESKKDVESDLKPSHSSQPNKEYERYRKAAAYGGGYGVAGISAAPCPKNYLFSCQPNLAPVPCSAPAHSYGTVGAYSAPVPTYVAPQGNTYGLPQGYGGFVPQSYNQFYQY